ncbi:MAG: amino acid adenylation domain-containing protein, partial [Acidobacteriota bacterium]
RDRLWTLEVGKGDRVGIYMKKSIDAVASIFGVLRAGAAYVPVDPAAPVSRNAFIHNNCSVKAVLIERRFEEAYRKECDQIGSVPNLLILDGTGGGRSLEAALQQKDSGDSSGRSRTVIVAPDDLAYLLYTSGSTGKPKGVMLTHRNAMSFVDWCSETFRPDCRDRFSSHAPFHFDLSILDIFVCIKHGATLVLLTDDVGKEPSVLAPVISKKQISIWYSAPSILSLLGQYGSLERYDYSSLRMILFAGEVFPIKHLRTLKKHLPAPRYFNLYGPTETNVCTFYEAQGQVPVDRTQPFPIGTTCSHLQTRIVDEQGKVIPRGTEGELVVSGPAVMSGYWNLPEQTAKAFLPASGKPSWYKTGDIVFEDADGNYVYVGRRDRMVKRRGYRVELGEIEAALYRHNEIKEAAVVAISDGEGVQLRAFLACHTEKKPSLIQIKRFCAENLPLYMIPDSFSFHERLPRTSTDKINYQRLKEMG